MRKFLLMTVLTVSMVAAAQTTMSDVLAAMPDNIVPYLTKNNRLDCIDFKAANMRAVVQNALNGKSELLTLSDRYADFQLTAATRAQLRLLDVDTPVDSCRQVVALLTTVGTDVRQSVLRFFSCQWRELPADRFVDWPAVMCSATLDEHAPTLTITLSNYDEQPASEEQQPAPKSSINLKWTNNTFK